MEQPRQKRWWYRLAQVLYSLSLIFVVLGWISIVFFAVQQTFIVNEYGSSYQVRCSDGALRGNLSVMSLNSSRTDMDTYKPRELMRFVCSHTSLSMEEATASYIKLVPGFPVSGFIPIDLTNTRELRMVSEFGTPKEKNYSIELRDKEYMGSWWIVLYVFVGGLIAIPLTFLVTRAIFLYVVFGEPFRKSLLPWQKRNLNN